MFSSFALRSWFVVYEIIQGLRLFGRLWAGSGLYSFAGSRLFF
jgi:hypothetical protein